MKATIRKCLVAGAFVSFAIVPAVNGETLFSNGDVAQPVPTNDLFNYAKTCCSVFDDFILDTNAVVSGFRWSGFEDPGAYPSPTPYASTTFRIMEGATPQSGIEIASGTVVASRVPNGITIPNYSLRVQL